MLVSGERILSHSLSFVHSTNIYLNVDYVQGRVKENKELKKTLSPLIKIITW